jgi:hypothetical protein
MAGVIYSQSSVNFGLYSLNCTQLNSNTDESLKTKVTLMNIAGWIPGIGALVGAYRIYLGASIHKESNKASVSVPFVARGLAEILCLGPLLMLIDVVITLARLIIPNPHRRST